MALTHSWMPFGDAYTGYLVQPAGAPTQVPAVVVLQEAWGVDAHIEDVTRRIAQAGYVALAPDCFAEAGHRPAALTRERLAELQAFVNAAGPAAWGSPESRAQALAGYPADQRERLQASMQAMMAKLSPEQHVPILLAATRFLREVHPASKGQGVAAVGFCMGGGLAGTLAGHDPQLKGAVIFYGAPPAEALLPRIACPVLGLYGEKDQRLMQSLPAFTQAMQAHGKTFTAQVYPGAEHAFFNDERPSFQVRAARHSWARLIAFLLATLDPAGA